MAVLTAVRCAVRVDASTRDGEIKEKIQKNPWSLVLCRFFLGSAIFFLVAQKIDRVLPAGAVA